MLALLDCEAGFAWRCSRSRVACFSAGRDICAAAAVAADLVASFDVLEMSELAATFFVPCWLPEPEVDGAL